MLKHIDPGYAHPEALSPLDDNLALYQGRSEFDTKALRMFQMARAALIYLCLAVHWEERRRAHERSADMTVPFIEAHIFDDEFKFG